MDKIKSNNDMMYQKDNNPKKQDTPRHARHHTASLRLPLRVWLLILIFRSRSSDEDFDVLLRLRRLVPGIDGSPCSPEPTPLVAKLGGGGDLVEVHCVETTPLLADYCAGSCLRTSTATGMILSDLGLASETSELTS